MAYQADASYLDLIKTLSSGLFHLFLTLGADASNKSFVATCNDLQESSMSCAQEGHECYAHYEHCGCKCFHIPETVQAAQGGRVKG